MRWKLVVVLALLLGSMPLAAPREAPAAEGDQVMRSERRVALVIGNGAYGPDITPLANPANDARDMAAALRAVGFEVDLQLDADRDRMLRAIIDFGRKLRDGGVGLFYFAGHAVQVAGANYMIPLGAQVEGEDYVPLETVDVNQVLGRMGGAENRLNIVVLDACRNNPFRGIFRSVTRGLAATLAPSGTYIAYSTAPEHVALDGAGDNSPYTAALVEVLDEPGLTIEELFKEVRGRVRETTGGAQTPWTSSSITGDFYFRLPEPEPDPEPATVTVAPAPTPAPALPWQDQIVWNTIKDSQNPADFDTFLETYPTSPLAPFARGRLDAIRGTATAEATPPALLPQSMAPQSVGPEATAPQTVVPQSVVPPASQTLALHGKPSAGVTARPEAPSQRFRLARSSSLGLEIFALHDGGGWCGHGLRLRIEAEDASVYGSAGMADLLRRLATVVEAECAEARTASLQGYALGGERPVYERVLRFGAN